MSDTSSSPPRSRSQCCEAAAARTAPIALWRAARMFLEWLHVLFGAPEDVARQHTFVRAHHTRLSQWLACAEAMLRRLLLIEASAYPKPNTRPLLHPSTLLGRKRVPRRVEFWPDKPQDWRVSFRVLHLDRRRRAGERARRCTAGAGEDAGGPSKPISHEDRWSYENFKGVTFADAWPLALRYEACLRVFNDPAPYARRLSRRLHATPHRRAEALRAPPQARHRIDHFEEARERGVDAWREWRSSA